MGVSSDMSLSKADIHNLLVFLERVQLTGGEAVTFVQLVQKLQTMRGEEGAETLPKQVQENQDSN